MTTSVYPALVRTGAYHEHARGTDPSRGCRAVECSTVTTAYTVLHLRTGRGAQVDFVEMPLCPRCAEARGLRPCGCDDRRRVREGRLVLADPTLRPDVAEALAGVH